MTFEEAVTATDRGNIIANNLLDSQIHGIIDEPTLGEFLDLWEQVFQILETRSSLDIPGALVDAVDAVADPIQLQTSFGISSTRDFRFLRIVAPTTSSLATVTLAGLVDKVCDRASEERFALEGISFPFNVTTTGGAPQARLLERLAPSERTFTIGASGLGNRPLYVTTRDDLEAAVGGLPRDDAADRARDLLGLVHRAEGDVMVTLDIPDNAMPGRRICRPTFLDGGNSRFMSVPRDAPDLAEEWGWTFDLRALFTGGRCAGLPERICDSEPVAGFVGETSLFEPLGIARVPRGDPLGTYDAEYSTFLAQGRTRADLMAGLAALR